MLNITIDKVLKNGYISLAFQTLPIVAALTLIPIILLAYGNETWGKYVISINIIYLFLYLSIGINPTINYKLPKVLKEDDKLKTKILLSNGFYTNLFISIFFGTVIYVSSKFIAQNIYSISDLQFIKVIELSAICGSLSLIISFFRNVYEAKQEFIIVSINRVILSVSIFLIPYIYYKRSNLDIVDILLSLIAIYALILLTYACIFYKDYGFLNIRLIDSKIIYSLLSFGLWLSLQTLLQQFFVSFDNIIITNYLGIEILPYYSTVYDLSSRLLIIPSSISAGVIPAISYWHDLKNDKNINKLIFDINKKVFLIIIPISFLLIISSKFFLTYWISEEFAQQSYICFIIIIIAFNFISYSFLNFRIIIGYGKPKYYFYITLFSLFFYSFLTILLVKDYGINGVAFSVLVKGIIDCVCSKLYINRFLRI